MSTRPVDRVRHIRDGISNCREALRGKTFEQATSDKVAWAAFERFLEIISEASRGIPPEWKEEFGSNVPWRQVADIGNLLRHVYQHVSAPILWDIYENDLDPLEAAVDAMLAAHGKDSPP